MRLVILTLTLLILELGSASAQDSRPDCPAISVTGLAGIVQPGEMASFFANTGEAGKNYDRSRLTLIRGGTHESGKVYTKLYRVPPGADNPTPKAF